MRESVLNAFVSFSEPLEGAVPYLYVDVKGLVTIAIGVLVDPIDYAVPLPLLRADGTPATASEIVAEWNRVKSDPTLAKLGHLAAAKVTRLRLSADGLKAVTRRKLDQVDAQLAKRFPAWAEWPADAQLAILSLAWACGAAFRFPKLEAALLAGDFRTAAKEVKIADDGGTVRLRNAANVMLLRNAAIVAESALDPSALYYPTDLESERPTEPEMPVPPSEPTVVVDFERVHPKVPLGRPALDDDEPPNAA